MRNLSPDHKKQLQSLIASATYSHLQRYTYKNTRALEIGCGPGQYRLAVQGVYVGIDITALPYKEGLPRWVDALGDAGFPPFAPAVFDLVFFSNVFYYFQNSLAVLQQVLRILKPGGILLIFDYSKPTLQRLEKVHSQNSPEWKVRVRNCSDWIALMEQAGFQKVQASKNSSSAINLMARSLLPRAVYFSLIDGREGSIALKGEK